MVTNFAAGISDKPLTHEEVVDAMAKSSLRLRQLILKSIEIIPSMKTAPAITRSRLTEVYGIMETCAGKKDLYLLDPDGPAFTENYLACTTWQDVHKAISVLAVRGAPAIGCRRGLSASS